MPTSRATVVLYTDEILEFTSHGDGNYSIDPSQELQYDAGAIWVVEADTPGVSSVGHVPFFLPQQMDLWVPPAHRKGTPLTLDLDEIEGEYDAVILVVLGSDGSLLWSNQPEDIGPEDAYAFARGGLPGSMTLPAVAFPEPGVQLIGWAGMQTNSPDDAFDVNILLSTVMAGQFEFAVMRVKD